MARCGSAAAALLAHCNLLLVLFSGAGLAAAARLKWDPSLYVVVRELAPQEYAAAAVVVLAGALATLLLAHLALASLTARCRPTLKRAGLLLYASLTAAQVAGEAGLAVWAHGRARALLASPHAEHVAALLAAHDHLLAALQLLARWHPLPDKLHALVKEAEEDIPRNAYAVAGAVVALVLLQVSGALLALLAAADTRRRHAATPPPRHRRADDTPRGSGSSLSSDGGGYVRSSRMRLTFNKEDELGDKAPLRTTYKNGRLVVR